LLTNPALAYQAQVEPKPQQECVMHERSSAGHHDEAVDILKGDWIEFLECPVPVPEEADGRRKQHSD